MTLNLLGFSPQWSTHTLGVGEGCCWMGRGDIMMSQSEADMSYALGLLEQWFPTQGQDRTEVLQVKYHGMINYKEERHH